MTQNNKPEWFEIVEADGPAVPVKAAKTLPLAALMVTALILGVGTLIGQVETESPASATQQNVTAVAPIKSSSVTPVATSPTSHLVNPAIATLPTKGDDENDGDEHEDEDDD